MKKYGFIYRNSLSLCFLLLMIMSLFGQMYTGWKEHNDLLEQYGKATQVFSRYLYSGHFIQATFENWESEFFQMALFVLLTIHLKQQGSSESNPLDGVPEDKKDECTPIPGSPRAVRKGGIYLAFYKYSLTLSLVFLFIVSFVLHWYGSWLDFNEQQWLQGKSAESFLAYLPNHKFWFESFQNWQSEFLSILAIVFLSIYLRQKGSSQSKPVNASHDKTGE